MSQLLEPLAEIVGARNNPADITSVLDHLAVACAIHHVLRSVNG